MISFIAERENAIMSLLEETNRETRETVERLHWDAVARYIPGLTHSF